MKMDLISLEAFIYSPYNRIADIKMLKFFSDISNVTIIVLSILFILSFVFNNFWCRYLCPYGALLGFMSIISPFKITRNIETCTNCKKCTKVCPEFIKVHNNKRVYSDECMACMACVEACPVDNTLEFNIKKHRMNLSVYGLAVVLLFIFFSFVSFGRITGNWENSISTHEYMVRIKDINNPLYDHNRGRIVTDESIIKQ
ncbi:MAG TPA: 4Fe-4S dicluster domain-containing protein [bacterium]|nr:4Fe-4S dicluster domain-containing protein [bacterium]